METSKLYLICSLFLVVLLWTSHLSSVEAQQTYVDNKQLDCYNDLNYTDGYACNGVESSCQAYLTFRSNPPYNSPAAIGLLLGSEPSLIAEANNISNFETISTDTQILIPVNCSCSGPYYQYNTSYELSSLSETYFTVSNNTYQGLTTCQALMAQNPYGDRNLTVGLNLEVPLRCACPTSNQTAAGVKYLLSFMVTWHDSISSIAELFGVEQQSVLDANNLSGNSLIYPFTPILIPLKSKPSRIQRTSSPLRPQHRLPSRPPPSPLALGNPTNVGYSWVLPLELLLCLSSPLFCFGSSVAATFTRRHPSHSQLWHHLLRSPHTCPLKIPGLSLLKVFVMLSNP